MTEWAMSVAVGLVPLAVGLYLLIVVRTRLPRAPAKPTVAKGEPPQPVQHDKVSAIVPGPASLRGRVVACDEVIPGPAGQRCVVVQTTVRVRIQRRWVDVFRQSRAVSADLHDDTGSCPIDLARSKIVPTKEPFERDDAELWRYTPDLAAQLLATADLPDRVRDRLSQRGAGNERVAFSVSNAFLEDGTVVRAEGEVRLRPGEDASYRQATGTLVLGGGASGPLVVSRSEAGPKNEEPIPEPPRSRARLLVTVVGALLFVQAVTLWTLFGNLYLSR